MTNSILKLRTVSARTGLARSTIYAFIAEGHFPRQISLGPRSVGWLESDINDWISSRIAASSLKARGEAGGRK